MASIYFNRSYSAGQSTATSGMVVSPRAVREKAHPAVEKDAEAGTQQARRPRDERRYGARNLRGEFVETRCAGSVAAFAREKCLNRFVHRAAAQFDERHAEVLQVHRDLVRRGVVPRHTLQDDPPHVLRRRAEACFAVMQRFGEKRVAGQPPSRTDLVEYYNAVHEGASLQHIERMRNAMVEAPRIGPWAIIWVQTIAAMLLFAVGAVVLAWLRISALYLPPLYVDVIAAGLQMVFMGVINVFFYLDRRLIVTGLVGGFVVLNVILTSVTLALNPAWYGYGFAGSQLVVALASLYLLDRKLDVLEYETFMLQ